MVAPDMLQRPSVKTWLGDIEPAWTLLDQASFWALRHPPSPTAGPIRLATDLTPGQIQQSALARNALIVLGAAGDGPGLKLTGTGNLSRSIVAEMCEGERLSAEQGHQRAGLFPAILCPSRR